MNASVRFRVFRNPAPIAASVAPGPKPAAHAVATAAPMTTIIGFMRRTKPATMTATPISGQRETSGAMADSCWDAGLGRLWVHGRRPSRVQARGAATISAVKTIKTSLAAAVLVTAFEAIAAPRQALPAPWLPIDPGPARCQVDATG